jgi:NADH:ubiquinone oxidoreductase subunit E
LASDSTLPDHTIYGYLLKKGRTLFVRPILGGGLVVDQSARIIEIVGSVGKLGVRFPILLTLLRLRRADIEFDQECRQLIGRSMEIDPSEILKVADWVNSLGKPGENSVIHRCVSISCTSNGAQELWDLIEPEFQDLELIPAVQSVLCLARCGMGPCMARDESIYLGQNEDIHVDDRPWREAPVDQGQS